MSEIVAMKTARRLDRIMGMAKRATGHTALAATFATAAELSRRGYDVAFTIGNTPRVDLLCSVPDGQPFKVQVKGISNENGFYVQKEFFDTKLQSDLFLVVVLVPPIGNGSPNRFFILSHGEAKAEFQKMPTVRKDGRPYDKGSGLNWGSVTSYEGGWQKFPQESSSSPADQPVLVSTPLAPAVAPHSP